MRYAVVSTNFGSYADPTAIARLAASAEHSGWDGFFVWDHLAYVWNGPTGDPWILLAAAASSTSRLRLGTAVSPMPRYQPHLLAGTLATLDVLSGGRMILAAGLGGVPEEFSAFGGPADAATRAAMTDEGLTVMDMLWQGEPVSHQGRFYTVQNIRFSPRSAQRPRILIWIGGKSDAALRRAARWDGWLADSVSESAITITPEQLADQIAHLRALRSPDLPFDIALSGYSEPGDPGIVEAYRRAGATWWLESIHDIRGDLEAMAERIEAGPPKA
jgi:alkanesulfonate monooxygenase SsuD/methylene tetrahydromethanopterin reductase-like flavin-dependent oxidoreductase (luciferase family)